MLGEGGLDLDDLWAGLTQHSDDRTRQGASGDPDPSWPDVMAAPPQDAMTTGQ